MQGLAIPRFLRLGAQAPGLRASSGRFELKRYVIITSLVALVLFAVMMLVTEHLEEAFFEEFQTDQLKFFDNVQVGFMQEHDRDLQGAILKVHEAGHVSLAKVFANMLWDSSFAPFVQTAQHIALDPCRALAPAAQASDGAAAKPSAEQQACFARVQQQILALPHYADIDAKVRATMRGSSVFKIKVFDMRGLTVYSSEKAQVGEDKANNQGWKTASAGYPASELTHRARFSAFEGVVEDRDLISSYIPILAPDHSVMGVFEIYSDATPFLKASSEASEIMAQRIADNRRTAAGVAQENLKRLITNNGYGLAVNAGIFGLFYAVLLLIVFNGQRILDHQSLAQEQANERERLRYREKMSALATMAANVSHEVGNPLATIAAVAQEMEGEKRQHNCAGCHPGIILDQTNRIATLTRQIVRFATVRDKEPEPVDVNQMVVAVCDFLGFDHRFRAVRIETELTHKLPARVVIPDHLNEALMVLLQRCLEKNLQRLGAPRRILVQTLARGKDVMVRVDFDLSPAKTYSALDNAVPDPTFELAHRRLIDMGGTLSSGSTMVEISIPPAPPAPAASDAPNSKHGQLA